MQKVFSEKLDVRLIKLVKDSPVLYDYNDARYIDFNAREVAWQKIGDELEKPAADCKVRWIHIRDVHRRIYRQSLIPGARRPRRAYKYDTLLEFMKMYYKEINAPTQSVNEESDNEIEEEKPTDNWDDVVIDYNHESEEEKPLKKRKKAQKKKTNSFEEVDVSACSVNEPLTAEFDTTDPVDSFLISIGNTLKKFSPYHLNVAKTKIFQIVQDFDLQQIIEKQGRGDASVSAANEQMYYQNEEILT